MLRDDIGEDNPFANYWLEGDSLAPPCQSDDDIIDLIIETAGLSADSYLFDLGCGDGRICIEATRRHGCRSCGVEIDEGLSSAFAARTKELGLESLVTVVSGDLCEVDLSPATVLVLYLLPEAIELIQDKLIAAVRNGCVLICHTWGPKSLVPEKRIYAGEWKNVSILYYSSLSLPKSP
jgi:SAM-dependent methyltransferase